MRPAIWFSIWGGDGGEEVGAGPLGEQIRLLTQGLQQGGETAFFIDGEDEGEPLQIEQGKF